MNEREIIDWVLLAKGDVEGHAFHGNQYLEVPTMPLGRPTSTKLRYWGSKTTKGGFIPKSVLKAQADYHLKMAEICKKAAELAPANYKVGRGKYGGTDMRYDQTRAYGGGRTVGNRTETTMPKALLALARSHTTAANAFTKASEIPDKVANTSWTSAIEGSSDYRNGKEWWQIEENALTKGANAWLLGNHREGYENLENEAIKLVHLNDQRAGVAKGELPGHAFRGNQYTTGAGGNPLSGTQLRSFPVNGGGGGRVPARRHPKGGGWVALTAKVDDTVYVGRNAMVFGNARVTGNAKIMNDARVYGDATVSGDAVVKDFAIVRGNAKVSGGAIVRGNAIIEGSKRVGGSQRVSKGDTPGHDFHGNQWTQGQGGFAQADSSAVIARSRLPEVARTLPKMERPYDDREHPSVSSKELYKYREGLKTAADVKANLKKLTDVATATSKALADKGYATTVIDNLMWSVNKKSDDLVKWYRSPVSSERAFQRTGVTDLSGAISTAQDGIADSAASLREYAAIATNCAGEPVKGGIPGKIETLEEDFIDFPRRADLAFGEVQKPIRTRMVAPYATLTKVLGEPTWRAAKEHEENFVDYSRLRKIPDYHVSVNWSLRTPKGLVRIQDANEAYSPGVDGETDVDGMMKPIAYKWVVTGETQEAADYAVDILRKNGVKDASAYVTLSY